MSAADLAATDSTVDPSSASKPPPIALRLPTVYASAAPASTHTSPAPDWLKGRWYVTHSSLPLWKDKRDVTIDYTLLPPTPAGVVRIEDTTSYRLLNATTIKTIRGADTPKDGEHKGAYDWRGYGWLKIASSHWEILGHGETKGGVQWLVTHFHKTLFTPEGIDVYAREKRGLPKELLGAVKDALKGLQHDNFKKLVADLFEVRHDMIDEMEHGTA